MKARLQDTRYRRYRQLDLKSYLCFRAFHLEIEEAYFSTAGMFHTTEYASKFVWHENAYSKPPPQTYKHTWNLNDDESEESATHPFLFDRGLPGLGRQQRWKSTFKLGRESSGFDIIPKLRARSSSVRCLQQECLSNSPSLRSYPLELDGSADARGIKSHFYPATIDVLLDLGMSSRRSSGSGSGGSSSSGASDAGSTDGDHGGRGLMRTSNQYFTSVYKRDYSSSKRNQ